MRYILLLFTTAIFLQIAAQDNSNRDLTEFSDFLSKSYYSFNLGAVFYPFSDSNLSNGFSSQGQRKNMFSGRFLLGYKFRERFAIQFGVMRPAQWFEYEGLNGTTENGSVWINLWSLSLKKNFKLTNHLDVFGEFGLGNLTRVGFSIEDVEVMSDAHYITTVYGGGFQYQLGPNWDLLLSGLYLPKSERNNQPSTFQITLGGQYNLSPKYTSKDPEKNLTEQSYFFPKRTIQLGYGSSEFGFFLNRFFSFQASIGNIDNFGVPIFWLGDVFARNVVCLAYEQTAYHGKKTFSLDWGVSLTAFDTVATRSTVFAVSVYPVLKFFLIRKKPFDFYVSYSVIGPTLLSRSDIDGLGTGPNLTYQDYLGFGFFFGKKRKVNLNFKIMHYSNGNLFTENSGVAVPLVISIGRTL